MPPIVDAIYDSRCPVALTRVGGALTEGPAEGAAVLRPLCRVGRCERR